METKTKLLSAFLTITALSLSSTVWAQSADAKSVGSLPVLKNWTPPNYKMMSQALVEETVARHPELQSLTLQGVPIGHKGAVKSTMFAGTFPERIGKMSSDVDVLVVEKGYTIVDPRLNMSDVPPKFTMLVPLRDRSGGHVGLAVVVFKNPPGTNKSEKDFYLAALAIRDEMAARIPNHAALFAPAIQP